MKNRKHILLTIAVLFIGLIITGASYAFWSFTSGDKNLVFHTSSNLKKYIMYSDGEGVFSGTLQVGDDYTDGIHTTISLYKTNEAANVNLKATIHMDVNQIGTNMQSSKALKWAVTNGNSTNPGTVISSGDFVGITNNSDMILAANLDVTLTEKEYTIWIWLDERENPDSSLTGETLDTNVWTEVNQYEGVADVYEITKLSASYQVINATVINRKNKIVSYAVTDTTEEPASWTPIADNEQNNIYNLKYLAPSAGDYYVWFKDSKDKTITSDMITVTQVNNNAPVCSFGEFSQSVVKNNGTATIDITCIDENTTIISDLKLSDLTRSGTTVTLTNLTKTKIDNGYKYTVTVKAGTTAGNTSIILPADKVKNNFDIGNEQIQSSAITVNNDSTAPTFTLTISNGGTYAKQRDATITIADNVRLRPGTYTIKYDWSTTALTCNELSNTTDLVVSLGETTKSATLTITNKTGAGKLYVCNQNTIYDEVGNQVAANTLKSANMYLDNTAPSGELVLEVNGGVKATLNVTDSNAGIQTPYYYMFDDEPITCNENTTGFIEDTSNFYVHTVYSTGMYYVCTKVIDKAGNTSYYSGSIEVKTYLKTLSGANDEFKETTYKTNITDIYFVDNMNIPAEAVAQYNLDATNVGLIKGWIIPNTEESGKYKLYIGSNSTIYGKDLSKIFDGMTGVKQILFDNFDTSEATTMWRMFAECRGLTTLDLSSFDTSNVTSIQTMFENCTNLNTLTLGNWDTSKVTSMAWMFNGCSSLTSLDLSSFNTSNVTTMESMFKNCSSLTSLNLSNFNTSKVTTMNGMFNGCSGLTSLNLSTWNTSSVTNMASMFYNCSSLTSLDLSSFNTSNVTTMASMFYGCSGLTSLNLSSFNTSNVTSMANMFYGSSNLTSLDLSSFNTSKVTTMQSMFRGCSSLTSLDLSNFNTSNVTVMNGAWGEGMFTNCSSLTSLNLTNFDTSKITSMRSMFQGCSKLTSLNLSSFNTSNVTDMYWTFSGCGSLTSLDLSSFNTSQVTVMDYMFNGCSNLLSIYVSANKWDVNKASSTRMFNSCSSLIGGNGTAFNSGYIDKTRAVIDTNDTPGYLTEYPSINVLENGTNGAATTKFLSTGILKNQIKKITFTNSISGHTANGTDTWDVSLQKNGSVLAWVGSPDGNGLYEMTIAQNGGVIPVNGDNLFRNLSSLVTIDGMQYFDTSNVINMRSMFYGCSSLTTLDLSSWDTSKVKLMNYMFNNCSNLSTIYVSDLWDTSNLSNSTDMFKGATHLRNFNSSVVDATNANYGSSGYLTYKANS